MKIIKLLILLFLLSSPTASVQAQGGSSASGLEGYIVFVSGNLNNRSIMMMDLAEVIPLTLTGMTGSFNTQPAVGPEGQMAWIRRNSAGVWELVENGEVISSGDMHLSPAYMPDGTLTATISGPASTSIYSFKNGQRKLLVDGGATGLAVSAAFSSDGSELAYVSNESNWAQIFVTAPGNPYSRMISSGQVRNTDPSWSPTGEYIAFVTAEKDICLIRPDGTGLRQLTKNQGVNQDPGFSPDGRRIVFTSDRNGKSQIFIMNLDGNDQRPLFPGLSYPQGQPVWTSQRPKTGFQSGS